MRRNCFFCFFIAAFVLVGAVCVVQFFLLYEQRQTLGYCVSLLPDDLEHLFTGRP